MGLFKTECAVEPMLTNVLLLILVVVLVVILISVVTRPKATLNTPPSLPIIGHLLPILLHPYQFHLKLEEWVASAGTAYELFSFHKRVVVLAERDAIKTVLLNRPHGFRRTSLLEPVALEIGIHGVFSAEGEDWKRQRKLTAPAFTASKLRNHYNS